MSEPSRQGTGQDPDEDPDEDGPDRIRGSVSRSVLEFVVRSIVDEPDAVRIHAIDSARGVELCVTVAPADMGKVIGRRGHVVQALRTLVSAAGAKEGIEASVEIVD